MHATVAGVVLGFLTPAVADRNRDDTAAAINDDLVEILDDDREINDAALMHTAHQASRGVSPLARVEEALHPYSAYLILPLFALANAGVPVSVSGFEDAMSSPVGLGIFLGLVVGAPVGGMLLAYASVRVGPGRMPENLDWPAIGGVAPLKGIGFTIAIFITTLAFEDRALQDTATLAVLAASLLSALHRSGRHLHPARTGHSGDREPNLTGHRRDQVPATGISQQVGPWIYPCFRPHAEL